MSAQEESVLRRLLPGRRAEYFDEINSTNVELLDRLKRGSASPGDVIVAACQTDGRGRHGKSFSSRRGGIYFSFVTQNKEGALVTVTSGVAVASVLEKAGYSPSIKWVNDVLLGGKKVCGILASAHPESDLCVVGIGINLLSSAIPEELADRATSLEANPGDDVSGVALACRVVAEYERLESLGKGEIIKLYRSYLHFLGNDVTLCTTGEVCTALDVTCDGELRVARRDGTVLTLNSGEISIKI